MTKRNKIIYWIATVWLALGMVSTGVVQLARGNEGQGGVNAMNELGYPIYVLTLLGIWKFLGVLAILMPKLPLLKEWAYAGFFFAMSGAVFSHIVSGHGGRIFPALSLLALTVLSWYFRPADRKINTVNA